MSPWLLDPEVIFLNHGSFGACPRPVIEAQHRWRERVEAQPVRFFARELEPLLDQVRGVLARFVGAQAQDLAFISNATQGVNTVLRSLRFAPGDELVTTDHAYNACKNALEFAAQRSGAKVVVAKVPFPLSGKQAVVDAIDAAVTPRTKLAMLDHVTSPTGLILPMEELVPSLERRGVRVLVDGAHAPGMLPLNLEALGASYYTGNLHKWVGAPKGAAFLHVRRELQPEIRPLTISHGANVDRPSRSRYLLEFDWTGTLDPSPWLCVPDALSFLEGLLPGGWPELMTANRALALEARGILTTALELEAPCPDDLLGSMAALVLPPSPHPQKGPFDPLQELLWKEHRIEVPVFAWPKAGARVLRVSAQRYNQRSHYEALAAAVKSALANGG